MRNVQNEKILTVGMERHWRGEKRGIQISIAMCYDLDFKNTN